MKTEQCRHPKTLAELRAMSSEDLIALYDHTAGRTQLNLNFYREELTRRDTKKSTAEIVQMTQTMKRLTWWIAGLTLLNALFTFLLFLRG